MGFDLNMTDNGTWDIKLLLELIGTQAVWVQSPCFQHLWNAASPKVAVVGRAGHQDIVGWGVP